jgi:Ca-activated chloride channel homolog
MFSWPNRCRHCWANSELGRMQIIHPEGLWALPLSLLTVWAFWVSARRSAATLRSYLGPKAGKVLGISAPWAKFGLRTAAVFCLQIALLEPNLSDQRTMGKVLRRDLYFVVDVSASMNCSDLQPTRLEVTKALLKRVTTKLQGDRLGIIAFTDFAYVQCPLTTDRQAWQMFLDMLQTRQFGSSGTQLRQALNQAALRIESESVVEEGQGQRAAAVILFTDGEDFGPAYGSGISRLRELGARLIVVGVGDEQGATVPDVKNSDGQSVTSKPNLEALEKLADRSGAPLFRLKSGENPTNALVKYLSDLPAAEADLPGGIAPMGPLASAFVAIAAVFLFLGFLFTPTAR